MSTTVPTTTTDSGILTYDDIIPDSWSHYFIIGMSVAAIFWAVAHAVMVCTLFLCNSASHSNHHDC